ncbi:Putative uncharacterized protein [Taphrina deformans PYCC 5710]|uniref:Ataxin-10 homolog n=1 Tax=Taphrina deformans (strain PYCC 5710 / ATCC 11124 / CBS 356.35 / IMI 108563 / JCM 9778 / NBRC 8474) TaxID=1097556 RepID=R4X7N6_TAPDE|nr:Putative uncharacterized protein [Taphrina deformans PYCC 5710]|eukprot:CCG81168.1 Putative uncharacterized protein [Taphrina deformans PYCC 5710]
MGAEKSLLDGPWEDDMEEAEINVLDDPWVSDMTKAELKLYVLDIDQLQRECKAGKYRSYPMKLSQREETWSVFREYLAETPPSPDSLHYAIFHFAQISFAHGDEIQFLAMVYGIHFALLEYVPIDADLSFKALSNLMTMNEDVTDLVLPEVLESEEVRAVPGRVPTYLLMLLRNGLHSTSSKGLSDRCRQVLDSGLILRLLRDFVDINDYEQDETETDDDTDDTDDTNMRYWLSFHIMSFFFREGFAQECISLPWSDANLDWRERCRARLNVYKVIEQYTSKDREHANVPSVLAAECRDQVDDLAAFLLRPGSTTRTEQERKEEEGDKRLKWTVVSTLISALADLLARESAEPLRRSTEMQQVVEPVIKALGLAHVHFPRPKGGRDLNRANEYALLNTKRDCIIILSNLSYGNKDVQDSVRKLGGLPLVLGQCNIDELNPYLREHTLFCIRNLLENNKENQDVMDSIKPVGVEQSKELSDLGYSAELKDGKIGVSRAAKIESINED